MEKKSKCPICGKPTSVWYGNARKDGLCKEHARELKEGLLVFDSANKKWIKTSIENSQKLDVLNEVSSDDERQNNCIICGEESGDYLFCRSCYYKYKNKVLLIKVSNCENIELLDESYEGIYVCKDGHVVKSKSERDIDNYLFQKKIPHAYEKALLIDGETFHPDFYLPEQSLYIEHWGYDNSNVEYTKTKNYKLEKYKKEGITLICTYEKTDAKDIDATIERKLSRYEKGRINYLDN